MLSINGISKKFDDNQLFYHFDLQIEKGDFVIITGESGCGKTTLLNMIGSIEVPDEGDIVYKGKSIFDSKNQPIYLREEVGFLFQNFALIEAKTVLQNFKLIKEKSRSGMKWEEALNFVNLPESVLNRKIYTLSGGEQQRVAIARLLIKKCNLILADEPTGSLDKENAEGIFSLLNCLNQTGKTIVMVTHDTDLASRGKRWIRLS